MIRRYATITAFEAALRAKLKGRVTPQRTYQDLRKQLAFDRVLARLSIVAPDSWLLKGGVALEYRLQRARATTDIDVSARVGLEQIIELLDAADRPIISTEGLAPVHFTDRGLSGTLTFWPSEFSQIRGQLRRTRYGDVGRSVNELLLQLQFAIGAHGAHSF